MRYVIAIGLFIAVVGCTTTLEHVPAAAAPAAAAAHVETLLALPYDERGAGVTRVLGAPEATRSVAVANSHVLGQTDTLHHLEYAGVRAVVYRDSARDVEHLVSLSFTTPEYVATPGVHVGGTLADARTAFGEPWLVEGSDVVYLMPDGDAPEILVLTVGADDTITALEWNFYLD